MVFENTCINPIIHLYAILLWQHIKQSSHNTLFFLHTLTILSTHNTLFWQVWFADDVETIVESLRAVFPFTYSTLHDERGLLQTRSLGKPPCAVLRSFWFFPCMYACRDKHATREYLECAIQTCGLMKLPQECITCLSMTISIGSVLKRCMTVFTSGSNEPGLLLLSKSPLRKANVTRFIPGVQQVLPRSYIEAEVSCGFFSEFLILILVFMSYLCFLFFNIVFIMGTDFIKATAGHHYIRHICFVLIVNNYLREPERTP